MKELIKKAEFLYLIIGDLQSFIVKIRAFNDKEREKMAIEGMESVAHDALPLLKYIIEQKDNIVNLSEIWHDATDEPMNDSLILYQSVYDDYLLMRYTGPRRSSIANIKKWIYINDLLPKGSKQESNT